MLFRLLNETLGFHSFEAKKKTGYNFNKNMFNAWFESKNKSRILKLSYLKITILY